MSRRPSRPSAPSGAPPAPSRASRAELLALVRERETELTRVRQDFAARIEELSLMGRVAEVLRGAGDLRGLAVSLLEVVIRELPADFACLMLADSAEGWLRPLAVFSKGSQGPRLLERLKRSELIPLAEGPVGPAMAAGRPLLAGSLAELAGGPWPDILPRRSQSLLALPLLSRERLLGAMLLASRAPQAFDQAHVDTLSLICDHAAAALATARLVSELGEINQRLLLSEGKARQAGERLQRFLDLAGDAILITDAAGRITYANQAVQDLGHEPAALKGQPLAALFGDPARAALILGSSLRHAEELELTPPGGGPRVVLASTTPMEEGGERMAILRDMTRKKALERQLLHAEKLASLGILAAGVAHEIGNPLSAISGYAQLLAKAGAPEDQRREFAAAIVDEAERIHKIIRDLLDYARPSPHAGQAVAVNQAVESVLNMFFTQKRLTGQKLAIEKDLAEGLPMVRMDRDQLQQVALNMVINAAQALEGRGGRLTIRTREHKGLVQLSFRDDGPGIPPEHLPLIFDPFFTTKPVGQGTGLGLSICRRIVSEAGGRIQAESRPGKGTKFTIWLPGVREEREG